jgi:hypothetical protein
MDLGKFSPDDFETYETAFINLLAQMYGAQGKNLKIMCQFEKGMEILSKLFSTLDKDPEVLGMLEGG